MRLCLSLILLAVFGIAAVAADNPPKDEASCTLFLDGQGIEKLTLEESGMAKVFTNPGESITLKPGNYYVGAIELKGGYQHNGHYGVVPKRFTLAPGAQHHLRAGSPLTSRVEVERRGRILELTYTLKDAAGRSYQSNDRSNPPSFIVTKDGKQIGGGTFEYG